MANRIKIKIDVSKIDKAHIFEGKKGKWLDLTVWINDAPDKYGQLGAVKQEWKNGDNYEGIIIGNVIAPKQSSDNIGQFQKTQCEIVQAADSADMPF